MIDFREVPFQQEDLQELLQLNIDFAFQPIVRATDLSLYAYEALMRPFGKKPLELIEEYEQLGKMGVIELATFFGSVLAYRKRGYQEHLCVNSFPSECLNESQLKLYYDCFPEMMGRMIVEIVEYTDLDLAKWQNKKEGILQHNIQLSLDDFPMGANDIKALNFYQPHYVKLDRSLVSSIQTQPQRQKQVKELIELFHEKNIGVVAEGIETKEELDFFRTYTNVDYFQGYYLGMPN